MTLVGLMPPAPSRSPQIRAARARRAFEFEARRRVRRAPSGLGCLLALLLVAVAFAIEGLAMVLLWNDFVVAHLAGARPTGFWAALGAAMVVNALFGGSSVLGGRERQ